MVKQEKYNGKQIYTCNICGFGYKEKEFAQKCENFCKEHKGCSLELAKYAVKKCKC